REIWATMLGICVGKTTTREPRRVVRAFPEIRLDRARRIVTACLARAADAAAMRVMLWRAA
ncbi:MAG: hypothetical protein ACI8UD_002421, partial [Planctomycetota bacterium]